MRPNANPPSLARKMDAMRLIQRLIAFRRSSHGIDEADIAVVTVAPAADADAAKKLWRVRVVVVASEKGGTADEQVRVLLDGEAGRTEYEAVVRTLYALE